MNKKFWNVVFLLDKNPPTKIVMLKRAADKKFAPNFYTGVGGKVEEGETILESAERELKEETGIEGVELHEFARCIIAEQETLGFSQDRFIDREVGLFYFWGIFNNTSLPYSADGKLSWVNVKKILEKDLIPSTKEMILEWQKRDFKVDQLFTIYVQEEGLERGVRVVTLNEVREGLVG